MTVVIFRTDQVRIFPRHGLTLAAPAAQVGRMADTSKVAGELVRRGALFDDRGGVQPGPLTAHAGEGGRGRAWGATSVGRVRAQNQDCFAVGLGGRLLIVADGMGGHSSGEVASTWAVETVADTVVERIGSGATPHTDILLEGIGHAQKRLCRAAMYESAFRGMGTTLVAGIVVEDRLHLCHVGDVRAYLFRDGGLERLTQDHSVVQRLIDRGEIGPEDAVGHPRRNQVLQAIGQVPNFDPSATDVSLAAGDRLLLCCDGLWDALPESGIVAAFRDNDSVRDCALEMVAGANAFGGPDNITVVVYEHP